jgi:hypothetical protein
MSATSLEHLGATFDQDQVVKIAEVVSFRFVGRTAGRNGARLRSPGHDRTEDRVAHLLGGGERR